MEVFTGNDTLRCVTNFYVSPTMAGTTDGWGSEHGKVRYETMQIAIKGMLPHNSQGAAQLTRLRTYKGAEHKQAAQKPEVCEF